MPIYPTYMAEQIAYQVEDADAKVLIVEDAAQLAKGGGGRGSRASTNRHLDEAPVRRGDGRTRLARGELFASVGPWAIHVGRRGRSLRRACPSIRSLRHAKPVTFR